MGDGPRKGEEKGEEGERRGEKRRGGEGWGGEGRGRGKGKGYPSRTKILATALVYTPLRVNVCSFLIYKLTVSAVEHSEAWRSRFHVNEWPLLGNG